ncbi:imelysin family protein [Gilvimarinus sp. 1_MG-2023]|uniref:imelysin family protein n=1 Tax=Gilvimarinus sp. 1_MG-2023 TaxID=3062638 RepID=UPI0026E48E70|nr:imelysin family protein [Gilvimarinus sp. 1_MG-2023]MDO6746161.1 imelysin family protein [Gilvimarinus sp. 1_MG-2023]
MTVKPILMSCLLSLLLGGCAGEGDSNQQAGQEIAEFDYTQMLASYVDDIIVPQLSQSRANAQKLADDIAQYCVADSASMASRLDDARAQWRNTMSSWQHAELFQVGPAAINGGALRNRVYAYASSASFSSCAVDQSVVLAQGNSFDLTSRSFNSRGLAAIEYLLFNDSLAHTCPAQIPQTQGWNERAEADRQLERCQYAQLLAEDVEAGVAELEQAWRCDAGDYRYEFILPANHEASLKALSDALFYIELATKDAKLGVPLSIHLDCSAQACPDAVESPYAQISNDNIHSNLVGFKRAFNGEALGFADIIRTEGFADIADAFNQDIDAAIDLVQSINEPLLAQSERILAMGGEVECLNAAANPEVNSAYPACQLHGLLKRITDRLRTDFITIVNLDLPDRGQSDND